MDTSATKNYIVFPALRASNVQSLYAGCTGHTSVFWYELLLGQGILFFHQWGKLLLRWRQDSKPDFSNLIGTLTLWLYCLSSRMCTDFVVLMLRLIQYVSVYFSFCLSVTLMPLCQFLLSSKEITTVLAAAAPGWFCSPTCSLLFPAYYCYCLS